MPEKTSTQIYSNAVSSVLETMFFTAPVGLSEQLADGEVMEAHLLFKGSPSGEFRLRISLSGARLLASGFLGIDEKMLSEPQTEQVVCELANMLCGSFVSHLESDESFDLDTPALVSGGADAGAWQASRYAWQNFELESGILSVALHLEAA